jgi:hypothetical protein
VRAASANLSEISASAVLSMTRAWRSRSACLPAHRILRVAGIKLKEKQSCQLMNS